MVKHDNKILQKGEKFNRLTVLFFIGSEHRNRKYHCICECGNKLDVLGCHLKSGHTKSCGCLNKEKNKKMLTTHGLTNEKLYIVWKGMKQRCYDKNSTNYKYYGGRGIEICDVWKNDFKLFYEWAIENGYKFKKIYKDKLTLDRIDVNGNYEPNNCKWVNWKTQNSNKRNVQINNFVGKV
jgi:hypothetical protein